MARDRINSGAFTFQLPQVRLAKDDGGSVKYGRILVNPDTWVAPGGVARRLVDILGIKPNTAGEYLLLIRGVKTEQGVIWASRQAIGELNMRSGVGQAFTNNSYFTKLEASIGNSFNQITNSKMEIDLLAAMHEVQTMIDKQYGGKYKLVISHGNLMHRTDPFSPIDQRVLDNEVGLANPLKYRTYGSITNQAGGSQSYVGNTLVDFHNIMDNDSDTPNVTQFQLVNRYTGLVEHDFMNVTKFPHTMHQVGVFGAKGVKDAEGDVYSPFKQFRRMASPLGRYPNANKEWTQGGGLERIMENVAKQAQASSVNRYRDSKTLSNLIAERIQQNITGVLTLKEWTQESLKAESIIDFVPKFLAEQGLITSDEVSQVTNYLSDPAVRGIFKMHMNESLKGPMRLNVEQHLKLKPGSMPESLALRVAMDTQSKLLMSRKNLDQYSREDLLIFSMNMFGPGTDQYSRMMLAAGHIKPTFQKASEYRAAYGAGKRIPSLVDNMGKVTLTNGGTRSSVLKSMEDIKLFNQNSNAMESLIEFQEFDMQKLLGPEEVAKFKHLSDIEFKNATTGYLLSVKGLDSDGKIIRRPLSGKFPTLGGDPEKALMIGPIRVDGEWKNVREVIGDRLEHVMKNELPDRAFIRRFGIGQLSGNYSIESLSDNRYNIKAITNLANATGLGTERGKTLIRSKVRLAKEGNQEAMHELAGYKLKYDLSHSGDIQTTVWQDFIRVLKQAAEPYGRDIGTRRGLNGKLIPINPSAMGILANSFIIDTQLENADAKTYAAAINKFAIDSKGNIMHTAAVNQGEKYGYSTFTVNRAKVRDGRVMHIGTDHPHAAHRPLKVGAVAPEALEIEGGFNVGIFTYNFSKDMEKYINHLWGDESQLQAMYPDEGMAYLTEQGSEAVRSTVLKNLDPSEYRNNQIGEFQFPYEWRDPMTEEIHKVWTKEPLEFDRLLLTEMGDFRNTPHSGALGKAYSVQNGIRKDIHMFASLGEELSKGGTARMASIVKQMGVDAERAWNIATANGGSKQLMKDWIKTYADKMGGRVEFTLNAETTEKHSLDNLPVAERVKVRVRNTDADQQAHVMRKVEFNPETKQFETTIVDSQGSFLRREAVRNIMKGRAIQEVIPEFAYGFNSWLQEVGQGERDMSATDLAGLLYTGWEHNNEQLANYGTSVAGQMGLNKHEDAIARTARNLFAETSQMNPVRDVMKYQESIQMESLEAGRIAKSSKEGYMLGAMRAMSEIGLENIVEALKVGLKNFKL